MSLYAGVLGALNQELKSFNPNCPAPSAYRRYDKVIISSPCMSAVLLAKGKLRCLGGFGVEGLRVLWLRVQGFTEPRRLGIATQSHKDRNELGRCLALTPSFASETGKSGICFGMHEGAVTKICYCIVHLHKPRQFQD